jgi:hypothetical protein
MTTLWRHVRGETTVVGVVDRLVEGVALDIMRDS